jgi:hypothetical protein
MSDEEEREDENEQLETIENPLQQTKTSYKPLTGDETRWMFDYRQLYWEIKARLMGGWITQNKMNEYVIIKPKDAQPMMNSTGIEATMSYINAFVTLIQGLSFIDEERIMTLSKDLWIKLAKLYYIRMEDRHIVVLGIIVNAEFNKGGFINTEEKGFDLSPDKANIVLREVMNLFETNMRKSISGNTLKLLATTEKRIETVVEQPRKTHIPIIGGLIGR